MHEKEPQNGLDQFAQFDAEAFATDLLYWFERNMRDLPWRKDRDPYKVWVSEIMLQQTRVDTVIPYFNDFMTKFPTLHHLAEAEEEEVLKQWEGLGYYSRARNLHQAVREVQENYNGQVPDTLGEISKLKGVGPYTAGAILSIAYGKKEPAVDGNVMRVLARVFAIDDDVQKPSTRKKFEQLIRELIPDLHASYFNQGIMELGALICTPQTPQCMTCPVVEHCQAYQQGVEHQLPVKTKKKKPKKVAMIAGVLVCEPYVLIRRRPNEGLLAKMYEFPNVGWGNEGSSRQLISQYFFDQYGLRSVVSAPYHPVQHTFTHLIWDITVYRMQLIDDEIDCEQQVGADSMWVHVNRLDEYPFSVSHQKMKAQLQSELGVEHA